MNWPFPPAEVPLSLKIDRGPNTFVGAIEGLAYCDYLFAQQAKKDWFTRVTLFELITFDYQLKLMFVEKLHYRKPATITTIKLFYRI